MNCIIAFFILGLILGVMLNINTFFSSLVANKIASFLFDAFMMIIYAFLYFIIMLSFNNGGFRALHLAVAIFGLFAYFFTIYKPLNTFFNLFGGKLNKTVKLVSKKLNFGKKTYKKLLHYKCK